MFRIVDFLYYFFTFYTNVIDDLYLDSHLKKYTKFTNFVIKFTVKYTERCKRILPSYLDPYMSLLRKHINILQIIII